MDKSVLAFIEKLELFKTKIKALHWDSNSLSQHELCDDIAERIADFQDQVSEVEQSISGKLPKEMFKPSNQEYGEVGTLKEFVENVIEHTNAFYKKLESKGDKYIGMRSDCESFLSDMQRKLYLVNFTLKEELKNRLRDKINESMYKRIDNPSKKSRSNVTTLKTRIKHIYDAVKEHGLDSRLYHDEAWQAIDFYHKVITDKFGGEVEVNTKPCADLSHADSIESDGGYCDYDPYDHMPRSKQYAIEINFPDGMKVSGYIKCMAAGTVEDPFASYDTCMVLWPKQNKVLENKDMRKQMRLTEAELKQVIKEAAMKILSETPLNYDVDNFSGRWNKDIPDDYIDGESEGYFDDPNRKGDIEYDLDDYASEEGDTRPMKDIENDYSWGLYDNQPIAQSPESEYAMSTKAGVPFDVDKAISMRNRGNNWTDRELRHGGRVMDKYVHGKYDGEDVGDAWDDLHYESKKPMKVTESELKTIIREAAMQLINEYNQRMANTKRFVRSTHGHGDVSKRRKKATPEERAEARRKLGIPEPEKVAEESIDIDPKNKGKFTATKKATGKSTEELTHSKNPLTRKRANFAKMAKRGWKPLKK